MDLITFNGKQRTVYQCILKLYKDSDTVHVENLGLLGKTALNALLKSIIKRGYTGSYIINSDGNYHNSSFIPNHKCKKYFAIVVRYKLLGTLNKMNDAKVAKLLE